MNFATQRMFVKSFTQLSTRNSCFSTSKWISLRTLRKEYSTNASMHKMDEVKEEKKLIYEGFLSKRFKIIKYVSLSTSAFGLLLQPMFITKALNSGPIVVACIGLMGAGIVCSPLLLNLIAKRYITELYYNEEQQLFTAYTLNFFNRKVAVSFKASDVRVPTVPGMFTSFLVFDKIPLFIDQDSVTDLKAYAHLMGYDKPMQSIFTKQK